MVLFVSCLQRREMQEIVTGLFLGPYSVAVRSKVSIHTLAQLMRTRTSFVNLLFVLFYLATLRPKSSRLWLFVIDFLCITIIPSRCFGVERRLLLPLAFCYVPADRVVKVLGVSRYNSHRVHQTGHWRSHNKDQLWKQVSVRDQLMQDLLPICYYFFFNK